MRRLLSCVLALALPLCAEAGDVKIYRTYTAADGVPVYTDRPINATSEMIAQFDSSVLEDRGRSRISQAFQPQQLSVRRATLEPLVERTARRHGVHPALLKAVIEVESGFNANARSPKGALGLMQVMPATAARYGSFDLHSPEQNLDVGARYLRDLLVMFQGNVRLAVAAYNAGEHAVIRSGRQVPPYQETMKYVPMVLERYSHYLKPG
jgi:soluble lytic murein transglycosylase-like protein